MPDALARLVRRSCSACGGPITWRDPASPDVVDLVEETLRWLPDAGPVDVWRCDRCGEAGVIMGGS